MTPQKIYVHLIDGTDVWVQLTATQMKDGQFEINENVEYFQSKANELFEFFPGDVVALEEQTLSDGSKRQVAKKLISKGHWPDRKFEEFKYKAALKKLSIDLATAQFFREEIERVKAEHAAGEILYPTIIETVIRLDGFNNLST